MLKIHKSPHKTAPPHHPTYPSRTRYSIGWGRCPGCKLPLLASRQPLSHPLDPLSRHCRTHLSRWSLVPQRITCCGPTQPPRTCTQKTKKLVRSYPLTNMPARRLSYKKTLASPLIYYRSQGLDKTGANTKNRSHDVQRCSQNNMKTSKPNLTEECNLSLSRSSKDSRLSVFTAEFIYRLCAFRL